MIVDWLRACYESDFCIDTETQETIRGRYYWAIPGAVVYPDPHRFGSAVWLDPEERGGFSYLGDQFANVSKDAGDRPRVRPLSQRFEMRRQLGCAPGDGTSLAMTADVFEGLPRDCYRTDLLACLAYDDALDVTSRETWCFVAKVIEKLYASDPTVEDDLRAYLPDVIDVSMSFVGTSVQPQWIAWRATCGRGLICAGTNNFQQACLQVLYGSSGPFPVGEFYTSLFWYEQALVMQTTLTAAVGEHRRRTFFGGHSYGAAVVALIAALESTTQTRDDYRLVTMGGPRFGNGQVYQRLSATQSVFLQNEGDPVPSLPPTYPDLLDLLVILGAFRYFFWQRWAPPPVQTVLRPDGTTYQSDEWNGGATTAAAIATIIATRAIMPVFEDHKIEVYRERICPAVPHPTYLRIGMTSFRFTSGGTPIDVSFGPDIYEETSPWIWDYTNPFGTSLSIIPDAIPPTLSTTVPVIYDYWDGGGFRGSFTWVFTWGDILAGIATSTFPTVNPGGPTVVVTGLTELLIEPYP